MGPEASSEFFNINGSSKWPGKKLVTICPQKSTPGDKTIVQSANTSLYLNVGGDSTSFKTLTFGTSASTSAWALEGDTIITAQGSSWGRQLNFLACKLNGNYWQVYLQTGSSTPSGSTCSNYQSLHLPCLC
ncbi:hypothetical protein DHEL01_v208933 [Diaporthe helianthi]|uniref:Uncharacterized protein n=1 Tax=Diaporthe helianthi TaxID=158607 RepID=A0A2P5HR07_DIAHE|nr:hypothetical protein DHEL01_v208933 [Diaporthe helianthi]